MIDDRARTLRPSRTAPAWARSRSGTSGHLVASGAHHVPQRAEGVEALAVLLPGLGVPLLLSAGQAEAQAPLHADWFGWSFWNRYRVRPLPSTRIDPSVVLEVETVAGPLLVEGAPPPPYAPPPAPPPRGRPARPVGAAGIPFRRAAHS